MNEHLALLDLNASTLFTLDDRGRLVSENEPGGSPPPILFICGNEAGNLVLPHSRLSDELADEIAALVEQQSPWFDPARPPRFLDELTALIASEASAHPSLVGLIHELPRELHQSVETRIVSFETAEGDHLLHRLRRDGMPSALTAAAFASADDFWAPWCVAMQGEDIAAIAFAARLGPRGAECGGHTFPRFRGRGLAPAATVAWSWLPALVDRTLFYSITVNNASSIAVARKLGLCRVGVSLRFH